MVICWLYVFILLVNLLQTVKIYFQKGYPALFPPFICVSLPPKTGCRSSPRSLPEIIFERRFYGFHLLFIVLRRGFSCIFDLFRQSMPFYHSSERWTSGYKFDKLKKTLWIHSDTTGRIYYICGSCEYESQPSQFDRAICHLARDRQH